jgi:hypothetical protein
MPPARRVNGSGSSKKARRVKESVAIVEESDRERAPGKVSSAAKHTQQMARKQQSISLSFCFGVAALLLSWCSIALVSQLQNGRIVCVYPWCCCSHFAF